MKRRLNKSVEAVLEIVWRVEQQVFTTTQTTKEAYLASVRAFFLFEVFDPNDYDAQAVNP